VFFSPEYREDNQGQNVAIETPGMHLLGSVSFELLLWTALAGLREN
jgi:hypothetical protein